MRNRRFPLVLVLMLVGMLLSPALGLSHPLGNFSISHYAGIRIERDFAAVRYLIDMAEIPTFQEIQETGIVAEAAHPSLAGYLVRKAEALKAGLILEVNGERLWLQTQSREVLFTPGAGALPTMKIGVVYRAELAGAGACAPCELNYTDNNFVDRAGWKEIVASKGPGIALVNSSVSATDQSRELTDYPNELLNSPPQDLRAQVVFTFEPASRVVARANLSAAPSSSKDVRKDTDRGDALSTAKERIFTAATSHARASSSSDRSTQEPIAASATTLRANLQGTPKSAFTELMANREFGLGVVLIAALVAAGLGAFHALEPGHGKTIVAAYLVGSRGTAWHALMLGLIVTASHTAGVYLLGAITLYASSYVVPERLYPWLGVFSGLVIAALGCYLLLRPQAGPHHDHSHATGHSHAHDHEESFHRSDHKHKHIDGKHGHHHVPHNTVSLRELFVLGITGGIIPCPAALVVLLSAVARGRIGFGLLLIAAFSLGLAAVLIAIGVLMVSARRFMARFAVEGPFFRRWLPLTSAAIIAFLGIMMTAQALKTTGLL